MGLDSPISYHVRRQIWKRKQSESARACTAQEMKLKVAVRLDHCCLQTYPCEVWFPLKKGENFPSLTSGWKPESTIRTTGLCVLAVPWILMILLTCIWLHLASCDTHTHTHCRTGETGVSSVSTALSGASSRYCTKERGKQCTKS